MLVKAMVQFNMEGPSGEGITPRMAEDLEGWLRESLFKSCLGGHENVECHIEQRNDDESLIGEVDPPVGEYASHFHWKTDPPELPRLLQRIISEVERQDKIHPAGFEPTRDGIRMGICAIADENDEALEAWREGKREPETHMHRFHNVRVELIQTVAVGYRTIRDALS